jgi:hypothetical protein
MLVICEASCDAMVTWLVNDLEVGIELHAYNKGNACVNFSEHLEMVCEWVYLLV